MRLNQVAFANSLAVLTAALYVLFALIAVVSPSALQFLFNAQFFGADVASLRRERATWRKGTCRPISDARTCSGS